MAFTKTYFVKKFFGLPISEGSNDPVTPRPDIDNYEYLCEDGSRQPVTNARPCSWAQRPWQGYMSNSDFLSRKATLQPVLSNLFESGKSRLNTTEQLRMFIKPDWTVVSRAEVVTPGTHLFQAQYKDVIERDGTEQGVIRFCVTSEPAALKCKWLKRVAYSRDIRPQLECVLKDSEACIQAVAKGKADVVVLEAKHIKAAESADLQQLMTEVFDDVFVGLVDENVSLKNPTVKYDPLNQRSLSAALNVLNMLGAKSCAPISTNSNPTVTVVSSSELRNFEDTPKKLLCSNLEKGTLKDFKTCNLDYTLPNGVMVKKSESRQIKENIKHVFVSIAGSFGPKGKLNDVFDLFGEFQPGEKDVIFSVSNFFVI